MHVLFFFLFFSKEKSEYSFIVSTGMFLLFRVSILRKHCYIVYKSLCHAILESLPSSFWLTHAHFLYFFQWYLRSFDKYHPYEALGIFLDMFVVSDGI